MVCWGIDVGATRLHAVAVDAEDRVLAAGTFDPADLRALCARLQGAATVAIDAPAALSTLPHRDDISINPKFRAARCGEVALGRDHGYWVPFVSPTGSAPPWMQVGFALFGAIRRTVTSDVIEVYPHACFRELARGAQLPRKSTAGGIAQRLELLRAAGLDTDDLGSRSHHVLDAAVAAITASHKRESRARAARCDSTDGRRHDGSAIWLPARSSARPQRAQRDS